MSDKPTDPLIFGFDIGISSVGWCVLLYGRYILALGARCFDKAETTDGESLNYARRVARLMRRRLRRRAWRLTKLARLLKREGLIDSIQSMRQAATESPWRLRVEGLDRKLTPEEWARVLYHLCKHRGFHWISRAEEKKAEEDKKEESGKVKKAEMGIKRRMNEKNYRSAAEMVLNEFPDAQRNKQGEYSKALSRVLLAEELALLFQRQREYGNSYATTDLEMHIAGCGDRKSGLFWKQKPSLSGVELLKMLGRCTFERSGGSDGKGEYRAPKHSFTAERQVWLTSLNNLRLNVDGNIRQLNEVERRVALPLPYQQTSELTYKQLKTALVKAGMLSENTKFTGLSYPTQRAGGKTKDPESKRLVKLPGWQELRKTLKEHGLETEWHSIAGAAFGGQTELLDQIAWILSVYKEGNEVEHELRKLGLPGGEKMIEALSEISFDKFHNLSLKALRKIVPYMETGLRYDEACKEAGYHHSRPVKIEEGERSKHLPSFYEGRKDGRMLFKEGDLPRNPVVLRALNQARKVLNALIRRYGAPSEVHIEMARDLSRPKDERDKISNAQNEFRARNQAVRNKFIETFQFDPKAREFEKYKLYEEQNGKCAYSLKPLDIHRVVHDDDYAEVDHALPWSRSYDDSKNNKVLVLNEENQNKGNRTPYEYLTSFAGGENGERWRNFVVYVEGNKNFREAKRNRLLRKNFGKEESGEFRERNLNDTRYICKFFKSYVEDHLQLKDSGSKRCVVVNGGLTSLLRAVWGLPTSKEKREESDRHHAMDAAIVAVCGHRAVQRTSEMLNTDGWAHRPDLGGYLNVETGEILTTQKFARKSEVYKLFPLPWRHFREELLTRLNTDDPDLLKSETERLGYPPEALENLRPLFVSRAPKRRKGGAAHQGTIYSQPEHLKSEGKVKQRVALTKLTLKENSDFYVGNLSDQERNKKLYAAIRARLEAHNGIGDKAFPTDNPLRIPDHDGNPTGPVVRSVTVVINKLTGIPVRDGIAKNDTMLRVDVFRHKKDQKYYLVPVYVHHAVAKELPNRAIVAHKDENDWTLINEEHFDFCFSLYPNDLVKVSLKNEVHLGYYAGCDRASGTINLWSHDRSRAIGKDGLIRGIGVKTASCVEKFHVDTLGNIYPAPPEGRRGLA